MLHALAFFVLLNSNALLTPPCQLMGSDLSKHYGCNLKHDDSALLRYARQFRPTKIGLDKCPLDSFNALFSHVDLSCIRRLPHYKYSVLLVLLKLYDYHIRIGHQGYDLYSMKEGAANTIITEFESIGGYNKDHYDMLNSGTVLDVVNKDKSLKDDPTFKRYLLQIHKNEERLHNEEH